MRHRAAAIATVLERHGKLSPNGVGLAGWIEKRVSGGETRELANLEYHGLHALILQLQAYALQNGIDLDGDRGQQPADETKSQAALCGAASASDEPPF
jgi:hypothetical protein